MLILLDKVNTHCSYQPTRTSDLCIVMGNSLKASTAWFNASNATFNWSSVRSTGSIDNTVLASLLRQVCVRIIMCFTKVYIIPHTYLWVRVIVINAPFDNISVISWRSVLLVNETGVLGENTNLSQVTDK